MSCPEFTKLQFVDKIGDNKLMSELEIGIKAWLDWGLLTIGGWTNVSYGNAGSLFGGQFDQLHSVDDESFTARTVWEGPRKDWVWEDNVSYPDGTGSNNPQLISNVMSSGSAVTNYTIGTDYYINYPLGRIVFTNPVPANDIVFANYSYRNVQTYLADDAPWWREIQYSSLQPSDISFIQDNNNDWSIGANHRVQLPAVIIESVPRRTQVPYQLGDNSMWINQDMSFGILAQSRFDRNNLIDILIFQNDKFIKMLDSNSMAADQKYPLDYRGMTVDSPLIYPDLISQYQWIGKTVRFKNMITSEIYVPNTNLYAAIVRATCEVVLE